MHEIRKAIRKLKNGRAAGPDNIQPELMKYAEEPTTAAIYTLFGQVSKSGKVPSEWREGKVVGQPVVV